MFDVHASARALACKIGDRTRLVAHFVGDNLGLHHIADRAENDLRRLRIVHHEVHEGLLRSLGARERFDVHIGCPEDVRGTCECSRIIRKVDGELDDGFHSVEGKSLGGMVEEEEREVNGLALESESWELFSQTIHLRVGINILEHEP